MIVAKGYDNWQWLWLELHVYTYVYIYIDSTKSLTDFNCIYVYMRVCVCVQHYHDHIKMHQSTSTSCSFLCLCRTLPWCPCHVERGFSEVKVQRFPGPPVRSRSFVRKDGAGDAFAGAIAMELVNICEDDMGVTDFDRFWLSPAASSQIHPVYSPEPKAYPQMV